MEQGDVGAGGLRAWLVLVAVVVVVSRWQRLRLEPSVAWAAGRALVQLLLVGVALKVVIDPDAPLVLSWGWVAVMLGFAAWTVRRRAREVPKLGPVALAAFLASAGVTLGVIFGFGVFPLEGRTLVPLAGMMVGNSMNSTVLVARRVLDELRQ